MRRVAPRATGSSTPSGFTLVELMVALAIGLVVIASAGLAMADLVKSAARALVVMRVDQDLRIAADLMVGELRRAGYWQEAHRALAPAVETGGGLSLGIGTGVGTGTGTGTAVGPILAAAGVRPRNPYQGMTLGSGGELLYSQSRDVENDSVDGNESFGFRLRGSTLEYLLGGSGWQAVTDASVVAVTRLSITPSSSVQWLGDSCSVACSPGAPTATMPTCPSLTLRRVDLSIQAQAVADPGVVREVGLTVRARNDALEGKC
jgi:type IV pilus assembly protein PilW